MTVRTARQPTTEQALHLTSRPEGQPYIQHRSAAALQSPATVAAKLSTQPPSPAEPHDPRYGNRAAPDSVRAHRDPFAGTTVPDTSPRRLRRRHRYRLLARFSSSLRNAPSAIRAGRLRRVSPLRDDWSTLRAASDPGFLAGDLDEDRRRGVFSFPPPVAFSLQTCSELCTGTIGARRAWTVSMISELSMPWR